MSTGLDATNVAQIISSVLGGGGLVTLIIYLLKRRHKKTDDLERDKRKRDKESQTTEKTERNELIRLLIPLANASRHNITTNTLQQCLEGLSQWWFREVRTSPFYRNLEKEYMDLKFTLGINIDKRVINAKRLVEEGKEKSIDYIRSTVHLQMRSGRLLKIRNRL